MDANNELTTVDQNNSLTAQEGLMSVSAAGEVARIQAQMVIAKKFPRDINRAYTNIMKACERPAFAEIALYAYPRGGQTVSDASIRLAEVAAQNYGNLDFGLRELANKDGESVVEAFCIDLETNTRQSKIFTVKHIRDTKKGKVVLTDERDKYEIVANNGARRLRSCILSIIPKDIIEAAKAKVDETLSKKDAGIPLPDAIRRTVHAFSNIGVTQEMIEKRVGHKVDLLQREQLTDLLKIFNSLKENITKREDWFDLPRVNKEENPNTKELNEKIKDVIEKKAK